MVRSATRRSPQPRNRARMAPCGTFDPTGQTFPGRQTQTSRSPSLPHVRRSRAGWMRTLRRHWTRQPCLARGSPASFRALPPAVSHAVPAKKARANRRHQKTSTGHKPSGSAFTLVEPGECAAEGQQRQNQAETEAADPRAKVNGGDAKAPPLLRQRSPHIPRGGGKSQRADVGRRDGDRIRQTHGNADGSGEASAFPPPVRC